AYRSPGDFKAKAEASHATAEGQIVYSDNGLTKVIFMQGSLAEEWDIRDEYELDNNSQIRALRRQIVNLKQQLEEERTYQVQNAAAVLKQTIAREAYTKKSTTKRLTGTYKPVVTKAANFPFWAFIQAHQAEVMTKGRACAK
ncbi:MAG: hypothetical protein ABI995_04140, partial [Acidobacteriota bacterium]